MSDAAFRAWALVNLAAFIFGLSRTVGLWYADEDGSPGVGEVLVAAAVYGWWSVVLSAARRGRSIAPLLPLTLGWALMVDGVAALAACLPPCDEGGRTRDIAAVGNATLGTAASAANVHVVRGRSEKIDWRRVAAGVALVAAAAGWRGLS